MSRLYHQAIDSLKSKYQYRQIPNLTHHGKYVTVNNQRLLNIASNDYLAVGVDSKLQNEFLDFIADMPVDERPKFGSTSSRLLTGNDIQLTMLENELQNGYNRLQTTKQTQKKSALVFNSGYHANIGLLPAITALPIKTLILADKLVHASIIDGMQLAKIHHKTEFKRFRHNDHQHLRKLMSQADDNIQRIIIVTESIFSMDGDKAKLADLVAIKNELSTNKLTIELYVDEAHAVGVCGDKGLGMCEQTNTLNDIDYLIGTFGKAFASMGAYVICSPDVKAWLINSMRPLIFSTALPPITHAWSRFVLKKMPKWRNKRTHLQQISDQLTKAIEQKTAMVNPSQSAIIPYILGDNDKAIDKANQLQQAGFYALPIRPPTVPANTARLRLVMNSGIDDATLQKLIKIL